MACSKLVCWTWRSVCRKNAAAATPCWCCSTLVAVCTIMERIHSAQCTQWSQASWCATCMCGAGCIVVCVVHLFYACNVRKILFAFRRPDSCRRTVQSCGKKIKLCYPFTNSVTICVRFFAGCRTVFSKAFSPVQWAVLRRAALGDIDRYGPCHTATVYTSKAFAIYTIIIHYIPVHFIHYIHVTVRCKEQVRRGRAARVAI